MLAYGKNRTCRCAALYTGSTGSIHKHSIATLLVLIAGLQHMGKLLATGHQQQQQQILTCQELLCGQSWSN